MRKVAAVSFLAIVAVILSRPASADDSRAQQILNQARAAIGGETLLQTIQGLTFKGEYRRNLGSMEMAGDREISFLLPDKYLSEDTVTMGGFGASMTLTRGLNGENAWGSSSTGGGGGGGMFIMKGAAREGLAGKQPTPEEANAMYLRINRADFTRYALAILLAAPASVAVEYRYAGDSDVEGAAAEVLDVTGPDKLAFRLFFDKKTHLPLLLSYRGQKPRIVTRTISSSGEKKTDPEDAIKKAKEQAEKDSATNVPAKTDEVDFFIRLTDYKNVGGLLLPQKLTFLTEDQITEEFKISKYELNPKFKSSKFQKN